jgi:hypothetical protein
MSVSNYIRRTVHEVRDVVVFLDLIIIYISYVLINVHACILRKLHPRNELAA